MQLSKLSSSLKEGLAWIGKELHETIFDHYQELDSDDWFLNGTDTHVAVSYNCTYIAIAHLNTCFLCICEKDDYHLIQLENPCKYEGERITSLMWIAFKDNNKENVFLLIGTSEGFLRIHSVSTNSIIQEDRFHDSPIVKIKSQSVFHYTLLPNYQKEIILIIYSNSLVTIDPISFKKELNSMISNHDNDSYQFKKWILKDSTKTNDACCLYSYCCDVSIFEVMDLKSEFDIVGAGMKPTIAHYSTEEIDEMSVKQRTRVTKIATTVANKVYNFASSWIWGSSQNNTSETKNETSQEEQIPKGAFIPLSNQFFDEKREIFVAELDYSGKLLATSDSLGRVMIFDLSSMTVMRIFKGYREAQCYWIVIGQDTMSLEQSSSASTELLLIFAPRRGILEVRGMDGRRYFGMTVGTDKRLVKSSGSFIEGGETSFKYPQFYLISQIDGSIQKVSFDNISLDRIPLSDSKN
ncbi:hypothetical protein C9374_009661 [Naegleria lovaniensis]|uniref:Rab3-GAP regulatory subunit N-terminal domain-containing protein n=1 Tax=Naegleria lovaniensis TaxID=51637 RepID=A0AA88KRX5_NAELO|nr:uncharacterized protein C9374_009661 [Naegleria lovaniensis]KAG2393084.1 hypothetical protein C9374_009661 [Naegleria lovaniensis]